MIFIEKGTLLRPKQIRIEELITVSRVLASRGFHVTSEGMGLDTILPREVWTSSEANLIFDVFHSAHNRQQLLAYIMHNCIPGSDLIDKVSSLPNFRPDRQAFTTTFEWYVGELLIREFCALSSSYGVKVSHLTRPGNGGECGDFDVISVMGDTSLFYIECKTGSFSRDEIVRMADRCKALHCTTGVMMLGKDIEAHSIKSKLEMLHPNQGRMVTVMNVAIPSLPSSSVFKWGDLFFVAAGDSGGNVADKLRTILRLAAASRIELHRDLALNDDLCRHLGYEVTPL